MHTDVGSSAGVPPIVLLAEDDPDPLERYLRALEAAGMWVATAAGSQEAMLSAVELQPDLVVTDIDTGGELIRELKAQPATRAIPVLALLARSPQPPTGGRTAEAWLVKPVGPDGLLREIRQLLEKSHQLRHESNAVTSRAAALRERSRQLLERPRERPPALRTVDRACPECGRVLVWIERGRLGGVDYDYYRWCAHACGLFAFDRAGAKWVKLA